MSKNNKRKAGTATGYRVQIGVRRDDGLLTHLDVVSNVKNLNSAKRIIRTQGMYGDQYLITREDSGIEVDSGYVLQQMKDGSRFIRSNHAKPRVNSKRYLQLESGQPNVKPVQAPANKKGKKTTTGNKKK